MRDDRMAAAWDREHWAKRKNAVLERVTLHDAVAAKVTLKHGTGAEYSGLCPFHDERSPSFTLNTKKGFYYCFGCGAHGSNAIDFVMMLNKLDYVAAIELLEGQSGLQSFKASKAPPPPPKARQSEDAWKLGKVQEIWKQTVEVRPGSIVDTYLRGRGLIPPAVYLGAGAAWGPGGWPVDLRFHPQLLHTVERRALPAMVAAFRQPDGSLPAIHRTYLKANGVGAAKAGTKSDKMHFGNRKGCCIRLAEISDAMVGGEGIETSLSAMQLFKRPGLAFGSADAMQVVELPFLVSDFVYAADWNRRNRTGEKAAYKGAKINAVGRKLRVVVPNMRHLEKADFNDWLVAAERRSGAA